MTMVTNQVNPESSLNHLTDNASMLQIGTVAKTAKVASVIFNALQSNAYALDDAANLAALAGMSVGVFSATTGLATTCLSTVQGVQDICKSAQINDAKGIMLGITDTTRGVTSAPSNTLSALGILHVPATPFITELSKIVPWLSIATNLLLLAKSVCLLYSLKTFECALDKAGEVQEFLTTMVDNPAKKAELARFLSNDALAKIEQYCASSSETNETDLATEVGTALQATKNTLYAKMALALLGIAVVVLGIVMPGLALITTILSLTLLLGWLYLDTNLQSFKDLYKAITDNTPGEKAQTA